MRYRVGRAAFTPAGYYRLGASAPRTAARQYTAHAVAPEIIQEAPTMITISATATTTPVTAGEQIQVDVVYAPTGPVTGAVISWDPTPDGGSLTSPEYKIGAGSWTAYTLGADVSLGSISSNTNVSFRATTPTTGMTSVNSLVTGDSNETTSDSDTAAHTIDPITVTVSASATASPVDGGDSIQIDATVTPSAAVTSAVISWDPTPDAGSLTSPEYKIGAGSWTAYTLGADVSLGSISSATDVSFRATTPTTGMTNVSSVIAADATETAEDTDSVNHTVTPQTTLEVTAEAAASPVDPGDPIQIDATVTPTAAVTGAVISWDPTPDGGSLTSPEYKIGAGSWTAYTLGADVSLGSISSATDVSFRATTPVSGMSLVTSVITANSNETDADTAAAAHVVGDGGAGLVNDQEQLRPLVR